MNKNMNITSMAMKILHSCRAMFLLLPARKYLHTSLKSLVCPQHKNIQLTVKDEETEQDIFTFKKLDSDHFGFYFHKKKILKSINSLSK